MIYFHSSVIVVQINGKTVPGMVPGTKKEEHMRQALKFLFGVRIPHTIGEITASRNKVMRLFTKEGILITLTNNLVGSHNNLFATRLGAGDYELGLVTMLPQLVGMAILIPGGIFTDSLNNKRKMVTSALFIFWVIFIFRIIATGLWALRWQILRREI